MSLSVEGQSCPVCHAYLFDDDDVVYCPVCGAPHHRDCYHAVGHCALEDKHGTPEQYDAEAFRKTEPQTEETKSEAEQFIKERCKNCGRELSDDAKFCPYCRAPRDFNPYDRFAGIKKDSELEGVTAEELAHFVMINPSRYVKTFFSQSKQKRTSWNWAAFLFPCEWSLFRKCYKSGILMGILLVAASILTLPLSQALSQFVLEGMDRMEMVQFIAENMDKIGILPIILTLICGVINIGVRIFAGLFSDYIYRQTAIEKIKEINTLDGDKNELYRKKGGVNLFLFIVAYFVKSYIPAILLMFL